MTLGKGQWLLLGSVAAVQTAMLMSIVLDRHKLLKTGREIAIPVVPVDPRDVMRGEFVTLGYPISPMRRSALDGGEALKDAAQGSAIYVTIRKDDAGNWKPVAVAKDYPAKTNDADAVLKGRVQYNYDEGNTDTLSLAVRYGIESYFVPEGTGTPIQESIRDKKVEALVAVGPDGTAALKGLVIGGERHEDPPLF